MEVTMYEDGSSYGNLGRDNPAQMKRKFTLDLNGRSKRMRFAAPPHLNSMLTSPDLNMLKLASPELDQMVLQQSGLLPGGFNFSAAVVAAAKSATPTAPSQEEFVKGFQDTLDQMHNKSVVTTLVTSSEPVMVLSQPSVTAALQYTQLQPPRSQSQHTLLPRVISDQTSIGFSENATTDPLYIKEEPQTVPSGCGTPPLSPIDMEVQERIKLERKRLRNRVAASKCRRRKLERIGRLEDKVAGLKADNSELQLIVNRLRDQVYTLKEEVMEHVTAGCQIAFMTNQ